MKCNKMHHPVYGHGARAVYGTLVIARSFDDDCWMCMVESEGEIYGIDKDKYRDNVRPDSLDYDIYWYLLPTNARRLQAYFKNKWGLEIKIVWGTGHVDRYWSHRGGEAYRAMNPKKEEENLI